MFILSDRGNLTIGEQSVEWSYEGERLRIVPWGINVLRFQSTRGRSLDGPDWELLPPGENAFVVQETEEGLRIENGSIVCELCEAGMIRYRNQEGKLLLEEYWNDGEGRLVPLRYAREYQHVEGELFRTSVRFRPNPGEHLYGMGQYPNDCLDLKHCTLDLRQMNTHTTIPFVISSRGYGFVWNNPAVGRVDFAKNITHWEAQACERVDYLIFAEETPKALMKRYRTLTGHGDVLPAYAAGFWQSKLRYKTKDEFLEVAREFRDRDIPVSVMVIDFFHWPKQGDFCFDESDWPRPEEIVRELENMGIRVMVSVWPTVEPESVHYDEMNSKGYLLRAERGVQALFMMNGTLTYFDATNPRARGYVWEKIRQNYVDRGFSLFWLDQAEPEIRPYEPANTRYHLGNGLQVANVYPNHYLRTFHEGQQAAGLTDSVTLVRSGWLGCQKYNGVLWSGDVVSSFDSLRRQVKVGLSAAAAGVVWWTSDIGGFNGGDPEKEWFRELFIRWMQFAVFCPVFRNHGKRDPMGPTINGIMGSGAGNEPWSYGPQVYPVIVEQIRLRERLRPYIMECMEEASRTGLSVMRAMFFEFPVDPVCYTLEDQYMFGADLLVAPVLEAGQLDRSVYLPEGAGWIDSRTGEVLGSGWHQVAVSPEAIPVFVRGDGKRINENNYRRLFVPGA